MPKEEDVIVVRKEDLPSFQKLCCFTNDYNAAEVCKTPNRLAGKKDRELTLKLPNWDNEKFLIISGIDVEKELGGGKNG